jgi:hypothetical protein
MHPIHSIGPKTHVSCYFGLFRYGTKVDAKLAELVPLPHNFGKESRVGIFSQRTHPIHSIEPKTHVLRRFRQFRYCTKPDAKLAELVPLTQKFAKQSRVRIFATNVPNPLHWTQTSGFRAFRTVLLLHESRCEIGRTGSIIVQVR